MYMDLGGTGDWFSFVWLHFPHLQLMKFSCARVRTPLTLSLRSYHLLCPTTLYAVEQDVKIHPPPPSWRKNRSDEIVTYPFSTRWNAQTPPEGISIKAFPTYMQMASRSLKKLYKGHSLQKAFRVDITLLPQKPCKTWRLHSTQGLGGGGPNGLAGKKKSSILNTSHSLWLNTCDG